MNSQNTPKGIAFMLCAMALMPFMDLGAKVLGQEGVLTPQVVWGRMFFSALLILPFALKLGGLRGLAPRPLSLHFTRAVLLLSATLCFFGALRYLPIADTLAIFFIQPILVTLFSRVFLGEIVSASRWIAVVISFVGTLVIIRPGIEGFNVGVALALFAGLFLALYFVVTRKMAGTTHAMLATFQTNLIGTVILSVIVLWYWQPLSLSQWSWLALVGFAAAFGHYLIVRAYENADASLLAPLAYTEIINAINLGWIFFSDFPDRWTFVGVGILIACAIYISWRERKLVLTTT
jgi:drug/metabolite transporter (DMT)-like permease